MLKPFLVLHGGWACHAYPARGSIARQARHLARNAAGKRTSLRIAKTVTSSGNYMQSSGMRGQPRGNDSEAQRRAVAAKLSLQVADCHELRQVRQPRATRCRVAGCKSDSRRKPRARARERRSQQVRSNCERHPGCVRQAVLVPTPQATRGGLHPQMSLHVNLFARYARFQPVGLSRRILSQRAKPSTRPDTSAFRD